MIYERRWEILDPNFPDELPEVGARIYIATVSGPKMKAETKIFDEVTPVEFPGLNTLKAWYGTRRIKYGADAIIIWQPVPPVPKLPKKWKLCTPTRCDNFKCEHCDNGYCLGGDPHCKTGYEHPEFSNWE